MTKPQPLTGVRVLDIASLYAAPLAATMLGDFGAEVIKVEPLAGDGFRGTGMWPVVARNKSSVTLDLREPAGCDLLRALIPHTDILVENYPPAVLERRGLSWKALSAINPRLIMVSVSCYGQTGPYADRPGSGTIGEGFAGLTHLMGEADGPPLLPSVALGDAVGALSTVVGTMMALYWRDTGGGRGQHIDATLFEPVLQVIQNAIGRWRPGAAPRRTGSRLPGSAIRNTYATADGDHVVISASTARHVEALVEIAGGGADPDAVVAAWIRTQPLAAVLETLVARRIPVAPVNDIDRLLADPHIAARGSLARVDDSDLGPLALVTPAPRLSQSPGRIANVGPALGAGNDAVYGTLLGLSADKQAQLRAQRVIG